MSQALSASFWESKLARRLDWVAVIVALTVVFRLVLEEDLSWVTWVIGVVTVVLLTLIRWPYGALFVLIGLSAMPYFYVEVFGWKARPEHFAVAVVFTAVCVWLLRHKQKIRLEKIDYWVLAYVAINYASSAFASPQPSATLRWALMNNLAVLPYFLIRLLVRDMETLGKGFRILLAVGIAESSYGILCYASHYVFGTSTGIGIGQYLAGISAPYGSLFEPNLFGAYTGFYAVLFLALYLFGEQHHLGSLICFIVASLATALSLSRAALIALVIASGWVFWTVRRNKVVRHNKQAFLLSLFALLLVLGSTLVSGVVQRRFSSLYNQGLDEETAATRYIVIAEALKDVPSHLLLGNGTASLQLSYEWTNYSPEWAGERVSVANVLVRIVHDTGLLGLTAFLAFLVSLWSKSRRSLREQDSQGLPMLVGLSAGTLLYAISFQSTDGTILAFCWVQVGFLASAAILMNRSTNSSGTTGHLSPGPV
jgi:O-Antigen ligase